MRVYNFLLLVIYNRNIIPLFHFQFKEGRVCYQRQCHLFFPLTRKSQSAARSERHADRLRSLQDGSALDTILLSSGESDLTSAVSVIIVPTFHDHLKILIFFHLSAISTFASRKIHRWWQIIELSSLEEEFLETGDSILADRGIMVQDCSEVIMWLSIYLHLWTANLN